MQQFLSLGILFLWPWLTALTAPLLQHQLQTTVFKSSGEETAGFREEWLGVYQEEDKVGYLQRRLTPVKNGYAWEEHWWLSLRLANEIHVTHTEVRARADRACALTAFSLWSSGGGTALYIKASIAPQGSSRRTMQGESINNGEVSPFILPLSASLHLPPLCQMATPLSSHPGASRNFTVFNPISMRTETVSLTTLGVEPMEMNGRRQIATKFTAIMSDTALYMWLDQEGRTLREEIAPGVFLQRESQELATTDLWQEKGMRLPTSVVEELRASEEE